jgi:hypothetical protein
VARASKVLRLWPWLAAIATGLLCAGCFAPFNYDWLCWIALTPLLAAIWFSGGKSKRRWSRDLLLGYVAGLAFFWVVFSWLYTVTVPGMILVGIYMACYFAAWSWLCGMLRPGLRTVREKPIEGVDAVSRRLNEKYAAEHGSMPEILTSSGSGLPADSPAHRSPWLSSINNLRLAALSSQAGVGTQWAQRCTPNSS